MKNYSDSIKTYPESKISVKMLDFFFDNIHSSQLVGIPMGTNIYACTPIICHIRTRRTSYMDYSLEEKKRNWLNPLISVSDI
jgi:hypothetical protein